MNMWGDFIPFYIFSVCLKIINKNVNYVYTYHEQKYEQNNEKETICKYLKTQVIQKEVTKV